MNASPMDREIAEVTGEEVGTIVARGFLPLQSTSLSLDADERALITDWMNAGGPLLLSGQEIAYDLADPASPHFTPETILFFINQLHGLYTTTQGPLFVEPLPLLNGQRQRGRGHQPRDDKGDQHRACCGHATPRGRCGTWYSRHRDALSNFRR